MPRSLTSDASLLYSRCLAHVCSMLSRMRSHVSQVESLRTSATHTPEELLAAWDLAAAELAYVPSQQRYARLSTVTKAERLQVST